MKRLLVAVLLAVMGVAMLAPAALAYVTQPTSMGVLSVKGYTDLAETGDVSIIVHWSIPYGTSNVTYPEIPASLSILVELLSANGTSVLASAPPYVFAPFGTNGYYQGVSAFYFNAADNFTAGGAYQVRISQSPIYYQTPVTTSYTMAAADWTDDTQDDFYAHFLQLCDLLLAAYPTVALKTSTDVGLVFSTYGESYFRAAVPGIQALCPQLFYIQDYMPTEMPSSYNSDLQDQYSIRLEGSEIKRGADRLGAKFGVTGYFILGVLVLVACIGCGVFTMRKGWGLEPGLIGASIIAEGGAVLIGNAVFSVVMAAALLAMIALMFTFVGRRA